MRIALVLNDRVPAVRYGGTQRVVMSLARALTDLGHHVTLLAPQGSRASFCTVLPIEIERPLAGQLPGNLDVVHTHCGTVGEIDLPYCTTLHGNLRSAATLPANTIFISRSHALNHGGKVFVHNGIDPRDYAVPQSGPDRNRLVFLAKAAWKVKNIRGAIDVARKAGLPLDVLGGRRINFKMGFRLTLDLNTRFHGMVDDVAKMQVLPGARGLVFPVLWHEPFGLAVTEAMMAGLPVFATPYGSLPELVPDFAGSLSTSGSELAEAVKSRRFDRRAIRNHFDRNFTAGTMARRYLELYERIIAGETLHNDPVLATAARGRDLLPWTD